MFNELEISTIRQLAESKGLGIEVYGHMIAIFKSGVELAVIRRPIGKSTKWVIEGVKFLLKSF